MVNNGTRRRWTLFDFALTLILGLLSMVLIYPVFYVFIVSFSDTASVARNSVFLWPKGFNFEAYRQIFETARIPRAYLNTVIYTGVGTGINLLMTAVAAYPLSRPGLFGRKFFVLAIVLTMFINGGIIPTYLVVQKLHLIDTIWAIVLPNAIWTFELLIIKSFYEAMSDAIRESAVVEGASEYRILFSLIMPLSKPALASIGLFYFMGHWNSYFLPMIYLNDANLYPLQVALREMLFFDVARQTGLTERASLAPEIIKNATIVISMIPVLVIYPFAQKYFAKGVMLGSEKG